jgi:hypothetical protein
MLFTPAPVISLRIYACLLIFWLRNLARTRSGMNNRFEEAYAVICHARPLEDMRSALSSSSD